MWTPGDVDGGQTLTDNDHVYPVHINELRQSILATADELRQSILAAALATAVVGRTPHCQYYCDGTDDDVQIQEAIDYVSSLGGGTVWIKEGVYDISTAIILASNVTIAGCGSNTILKTSKAVNVFFSGVGVDNYKVSDLYLDGDNVGLSGIRCEATSSNVNVSGVYAKNFTEYGILLSRITKFRIFNCECSDNITGATEGRGIYLALSDDVVVRDCTTNGNKRYGIMLHTMTNTRIINCTANNNTGDRGIFAFKGSNIIIDGCTANENNFAGITTESDNSKIINCTADDNTTDGILIRTNSDAHIYKVYISGNTCRGNGRDGIRGDAGTTTNIYDVHIVNNKVSNNVNGIEIRDYIYDAIIAGNQVNENTSRGIYVTENISRFLINNNVIYGTNDGDTGIRYGGTYVKVADNVITNCATPSVDIGTNNSFDNVWDKT